MLPEVAITKARCWRSTLSSASRSARRKVSWPNMSKISLNDAPLRRSISRSSSMKGTSSRAASKRPSVDLPPPRSPISAMRALRRSSDGSLKCRSSNSRASASALGGSRSRNCESRTRSSARLGAFVDQLRHRHADGARDPPQQHDRAVALAGFELRQIALRHFGVLRQRLARHAALVAQRAHALAQAAQIGVGVAARAAWWRLHAPSGRTELYCQVECRASRRDAIAPVVSCAARCYVMCKIMHMRVGGHGGHDGDRFPDRSVALSPLAHRDRRRRRLSDHGRRPGRRARRAATSSSSTPTISASTSN